MKATVTLNKAEPKTLRNLLGCLDRDSLRVLAKRHKIPQKRVKADLVGAIVRARRTLPNTLKVDVSVTNVRGKG